MELMKPHFTHIVWTVFLALLTAWSAAATPQDTPHAMRGPLRRHPANPRYFTDDSGRAILLTGSHTWNNLVDMGPIDPPPRFDYEAYLNWMAGYGHNFFRMWAWELTEWNTAGNREKDAQVHRAYPHPWKRTGPGNALDGKAKFNLKEFDQEYFDRLRQRTKLAQDRGMYVAVMLFEGWGIQFSPDGWKRHPFHPENNINGINDDVDGDGKGLEIHTSRSKEITEIQRAYVRKVVDTVNEFDNVLYEISNENHPPSTQWQYDMIRFIHNYEKSKPKQHPVGMTFQYKGGTNKALFDSPADWVSPNPDGGYRDNPPAADGSKVIVTDTDHLWGIGGNVGWVWKSVMRGMNPIFMDPYDGKVLSKSQDLKWTEPVRRTMGVALKLSRRVDLATLTPHGELASSGFCLANSDKEYLVYMPEGKEATVDLSAAAKDFDIKWINAISGETTAGGVLPGGAKRLCQPPFKADAVLHLKVK